MAPLIQDCDFSLSSHEDAYDNQKIVAPLHEQPIKSTPRRVSFGAMVAVHDIMNRYDYTSEEKQTSWFDIDEMRQMKLNARSDAKLLDSGVNFQGESSSSRGLESRTQRGMKRKRRSRDNVYDAVFSEIEFQEEEQFFDDYCISDAYFAHSVPCARRARTLGELDAQEAIHIHFNINQKAMSGSFLKFDPSPL